MKFKILITMAIIGVFVGSQVFALNVVNFSEGQSSFVELSLKNLNLIKFPSSGIRVYTSSKLLDIKIDEGNVFVKFLEEGIVSPQEVFFVIPSAGVFSMILIPKEIPAQTIIVNLLKEDISDALKWETSHSYVAGLKELIKNMYEERLPRGFAVKEVNEDKSSWKEVRMVLKRIYSGATLQGEVYELTNISKEPVKFIENEFYEKGILAVSLDRHELKPGQKTELYLVKKTRTQRDFEKVLKKTNPLDVLK
jgi:conjugal transfer pilus assembly protein TraK